MGPGSRRLANSSMDSPNFFPQCSPCLKATDRPFIFRMLEQAGLSRIRFISGRPLVNYTFTSDNGLMRFNRSVILGLTLPILAVSRHARPGCSIDLYISHHRFHWWYNDALMTLALHIHAPLFKVSRLYYANDSHIRPSRELQATKLWLTISRHIRHCLSWCMLSWPFIPATTRENF